MARILIIDDEEDVRYVLRRILDTAGHEVLEAADGGQGNEISKTEELDWLKEHRARESRYRRRRWRRKTARNT